MCRNNILKADLFTLLLISFLATIVLLYPSLYLKANTCKCCFACKMSYAGMQLHFDRNCAKMSKSLAGTDTVQIESSENASTIPNAIDVTVGQFG